MTWTCYFKNEKTIAFFILFNFILEVAVKLSTLLFFGCHSGFGVSQAASVISRFWISNDNFLCSSLRTLFCCVPLICCWRFYSSVEINNLLVSCSFSRILYIEKLHTCVRSHWKQSLLSVRQYFQNTFCQIFLLFLVHSNLLFGRKTVAIFNMENSAECHRL